jgi:hypothetical protein
MCGRNRVARRMGIMGLKAIQVGLCDLMQRRHNQEMQAAGIELAPTSPL